SPVRNLSGRGVVERLALLGALLLLPACNKRDTAASAPSRDEAKAEKPADAPPPPQGAAAAAPASAPMPVMKAEARAGGAMGGKGKSRRKRNSLDDLLDDGASAPSVSAGENGKDADKEKKKEGGPG